MKILKSVLTISFILSLVIVNAQINPDEQWPSFRGPFAKGYLENSKPPVEWDVSAGKNIKWQTSIPGLGHSCPVIWGDKLFITTAISGSGNNELKVGLYGDIDAVNDDSEHEFKVYCLDKNTGEIIWQKLAHKGIPHTKRHTKATHANCTPATDGEHLVVFFGSEGLYCYDLNGNLLWKKDLGVLNAGPYTDPDVEWGFASSPIIHKGKVIVQCDFLGDCFIASFDVNSGEQAWRTSRDEISTWSSPNIVESDGKTQVVVNGFKHMGGYNFETGEEIWKMSGGGDAPAPTPVFAHNLIFINNAHGRFSPIYVVKPTAKENITLKEDETSNDNIVWSINRGGSYMLTPLIYGDYLYNLRINGALTVYEAENGKLMYRQSLGVSGGVTASCVAADGKVYCSAENGIVYVLKAGPEYELLATNDMNDILMATPAISGNTIYYRAMKSVIAVGK
ncbi:MAG: PQQ-binding-like beta-propeller repeat protein [Prolixibacteraceae bacterium]|nr:PQQ-binding-like beta-propeller repeat protein [Prolixibacteraceae bacterium]